MKEDESNLQLLKDVRILIAQKRLYFSLSIVGPGVGFLLGILFQRILTEVLRG